MQFEELLRSAGLTNGPNCWAEYYDEAMLGHEKRGPLSEADLFCVPGDARNMVRSLWESIRNHEALSRLLELCRFAALHHTWKWGQWDAWPTPCERAGGDWFYLLALLSNMDNLRAEYARRGIPEEILTDTLLDLHRYLYETRHFIGRDGLADIPFGWMTLHFSARIFRLKRLQFEPSVLDEALVLADGRKIGEGSHVLSVHIPTGLPLAPEDYRASFAMAAPFFHTYFHERTFKAMICGSWLLDPALGDLLPHDSNILAFQREFEHVRMVGVDHSVYKHVFNSKYTQDHKSLPETTSLQRSLKAFLMSGKEIHAALGLIPLA